MMSLHDNGKAQGKVTGIPLLREWASGKAARREDAEAAVNAISLSQGLVCQEAAVPLEN